jgi:hypothetical protein
MLFEDASAQCPHCFESINVPIDPGGGQDQEIYIDCEVCCRSILVHAKWSEFSEMYEINLDRG